MEPIYKLFTGNHIDLSKIVDVGSYNIYSNTASPQIDFYIHFQLMDKPVRYEYYGNFFEKKQDVAENKNQHYFPNIDDYEIKAEIRHLLPVIYTIHDMVHFAETELQKLYDNFIADWKAFKATQF